LPLVQRVRVKVPYERKDRAKEFGARWRPEEKRWEFDFVVPFIVQECGLKSEKVERIYRELVDLRKREDADGDPRLRPYQRVDVDTLARCATEYDLRGLALFNKPRTGKTPTTLCLLERLQAYPALIVVPAVVVLNWVEEARRWLPENRKVVALVGTKKQREKLRSEYADVYVISYETLRQDVEALAADIPLHAVVVDEAHRLRNTKTAQSQACFNLAVGASLRIALTGTPIVNRPSDLYGILHFLYPNVFTSRTRFIRAWTDYTEDMWSGGLVDYAWNEKTKPALQQVLDAVTVERKRADVMRWLPPKHLQHVLLQLSEEQWKLYRKMKEDFFIQDGDVEIDAPTVLAQLTRLRQIALDPGLLGLDGPSAKYEYVLDFVDGNLTERGLVVMSTFTSALKRLADQLTEKGLRVGFITGEQDTQEKADVQAAFQRGDIDVVLCNVRAAGVGITLDRADTLIFLDRAFTPAENEQAEDRIVPTREDRLHPIDIIVLTAVGTVDQWIEKILDEKVSIAEALQERKEELLAWLR